MMTTIGPDPTTDWFADLCARYNLTPTEPRTATGLQVDHVLFTATGDPRYIRSIRQTARYVTVRYADGWTDDFLPDERISLIATAA